MSAASFTIFTATTVFSSPDWRPNASAFTTWYRGEVNIREETLGGASSRAAQLIPTFPKAPAPSCFPRINRSLGNSNSLGAIHNKQFSLPLSYLLYGRRSVCSSTGSAWGGFVWGSVWGVFTLFMLLMSPSSNSRSSAAVNCRTWRQEVGHRVSSHLLFEPANVVEDDGNDEKHDDGGSGRTGDDGSHVQTLLNNLHPYLCLCAPTSIRSNTSEITCF